MRYLRVRHGDQIRHHSAGSKIHFYLVKTWNLAKRNMTRKLSRTLLNRSSSRLFLDDEVTTTILRVPGVAVYIYLAVAPFFLPFPLDPLLD